MIAGLTLICLFMTADLVARESPPGDPPDLMKGEPPSTKGGFNVGPTGSRGWAFHRGTDSDKSRQIMVRSVDKGAPAEGRLVEGNLFLGGDVSFSREAQVRVGCRQPCIVAHAFGGGPDQKGILTVYRGVDVHENGPVILQNPIATVEGSGEQGGPGHSVSLKQ